MDDPNHTSHADHDAGSEKMLYCIRHAQSESNAKLRSVGTYFQKEFHAAKCSLNIKDPALSAQGQQQIETLQRKLDAVDFVARRHIDICFVSPFSRAIDTALGLLQFNPSVEIVVLPDSRPHFKSAQSTGTLRKSSLAQKYRKYEQLSFDHVTRQV